jgi:hypothetical protein
MIKTVTILIFILFPPLIYFFVLYLYNAKLKEEFLTLWIVFTWPNG